MSEQQTRPYARITIVGKTLTITRWDPALAGPGAITGKDSAKCQVDVADVIFLGEEGEHEVIVASESPGGLTEKAREVLIEWASLVGKKRVWLSGEVIDLSEGLPVTDKAAVCCPTCGAEFEAEGFNFWQAVRAAGLFPTACKSCGGLLPQWSLAAEGGRPSS